MNLKGCREGERTPNVPSSPMEAKQFGSYSWTHFAGAAIVQHRNRKLAMNMSRIQRSLMSASWLPMRFNRLRKTVIYPPRFPNDCAQAYETIVQREASYCAFDSKHEHTPTLIYTDEYSIYARLAEWGYEHKKVMDKGIRPRRRREWVL